ncbi:hypothetical protein HS7_14550 [Sulfolobales archaeon HS-7]|nr:hypothetical protein HS7_14550 [Sulfolobales archaeon HS-7]
MVMTEVKEILIRLLREDLQVREELKQVIGIDNIVIRTTLENVSKSLEEQAKLNLENRQILNSVVRTLNELVEAQKRSEDALTKLSLAMTELTEVKGLKNRIYSIGMRWDEDNEEVIGLFLGK